MVIFSLVGQRKKNNKKVVNERNILVVAEVFFTCGTAYTALFDIARLCTGPAWKFTN